MVSHHWSLHKYQLPASQYYAHTILDESPERDSRLALSYSTAVVLKELSAWVLGVDAPEKCKKLKMRSKGRILIWSTSLNSNWSSFT